MVGGGSQKLVSLDMQKVQQSSAPSQLGVQHSKLTRKEMNQVDRHACESCFGDPAAWSSAIPKCCSVQTQDANPSKLCRAVRLRRELCLGTG